MTRKTKAVDNQTTLDIAVETITSEVITDSTITSTAEASSAEASSAVLLPDLHAPAVNTSEPAVSYKIDFSDKSQWFASRDGGKTKAGTGSAVVAGAPIDLLLSISKAGWGDGYDQRLRLAFMEQEGQMAELNINAVNRTAAGELYVTSPARSLVGGLLAISESDDDILALCDYARFTVKPGKGRGVFIELDIAVGSRWVAACSAANTNRIAKEPAGLHAQLTQIKQRFRSAGCLLTSAAISGEIEGYDADLRLLAAADPAV
ncbi:MAG: hypothetical protein LW834_07955 [Cyanobium sp. 49614_E6]|jgi:hypothetical protein|nr:hypothetical protein [Cyanobium sp. 49614_E6]